MHIAIIMDGNGRWAVKRGLPRTAGHIEGAKAVRRTVEAAARAGVETLTLYAFSADNWKRPRSEVSTLMNLFLRYLESEIERCRKESIRINVIGRRDRLSPALQQVIEQSECVTANCDRMLLRIAVDYSARHGIMAAARSCSAEWRSVDDFKKALNRITHSSVDTEDVDLLIRTGGEQRLSDFLLWESAYAELYFCDRLWPDFTETDFQLALTNFSHRHRRFGNVS